MIFSTSNATRPNQIDSRFVGLLIKTSERMLKRHTKETVLATIVGNQWGIKQYDVGLNNSFLQSAGTD
jgi:hypothetical protein